VTRSLLAAESLNINPTGWPTLATGRKRNRANVTCDADRANESRVTEDRSELAFKAENIARAVSQALGISPDRADQVR